MLPRVRRLAVMSSPVSPSPRVAPQLAFLEGGPPEGIDEAIWSLYYPRRLSFVAADAEAARALVSDEGLRGAARELAGQLARPLSTLVSWERTSGADAIARKNGYLGAQIIGAAAQGVSSGEAIRIDTTHMTINEVVERMRREVEARRPLPAKVRNGTRASQ